jgi:hypothetical protein
MKETLTLKVKRSSPYNTPGRPTGGGVAQTELGKLRACYVSWLLPGLEWNWCRRH